MLKITPSNLSLELRKKEPFFSKNLLWGLTLAFLFHVAFFSVFKIISHTPTKPPLPLDPVHLSVDLTRPPKNPLEPCFWTLAKKRATLPNVPLPLLTPPQPTQAQPQVTPPIQQAPYTSLSTPLPLSTTYAPLQVLHAPLKHGPSPRLPKTFATKTSLFYLRVHCDETGHIKTYDIEESYGPTQHVKQIENDLNELLFEPPYPQTIYILVETPCD